MIRLVLLGVTLDVIDRILDGRDFLSVLVRNLNVEGLLELHYELNDIERGRLEYRCARCAGQRIADSIVCEWCLGMAPAVQQ